MNESTVTEPQTEQDDWAAAMAEQQAADAQPTTDDDNGSPPPSSAHLAGDSLTKPSPVFEQFSRNDVLNDTRNDIDMILDIPVQLTVELGRTRIAIKNLLQLAQGSVVELNGMAGEPMDVLVNGCLIAQGEVVVVNEKFGIRLTDIITPSERIRKLNR
ncbi:MAG TPA: flagellar motor switch protein FliN [Nitrosomonas europaea]|uniref:Flagellar motor switch protein FliN n=1 Tax=Nitrosomonas europaea (strain ATCC 19718 / CIP 103999 / KCTC 2705 / NBRC 14298) TaxID=228410 RepID=Q82X36_NITEU|nr:MULTISPECIES: flagellar motor switch protein FliN [Nitrosomonas]CAD84374.1 possible flagellar motor switch FliN [Nitrosomonas europaea ATCC 19718]SDW71939.1 flagellar motor switch protein FliN/FliY [Nitrosomonas europaea]SES98816.1 flagellar motor switch protein FliN/FliY [Nitrosomonas europaea]SJZ49196.1 flagellar motor switch protein FliN/FliY [Nitrosomonas europaea]HBF24662.1 flagellar motor switch protein FliN [Nitrosomonas sp.]